MDPELKLAVVAANGEINAVKRGRSGKNKPGHKRASGKHKPKERGSFKDFVASRTAAAHRVFDKQAELRHAELSTLRQRVASLYVLLDAANKERFRAVAALENACGYRVARALLS